MERNAQDPSGPKEKPVTRDEVMALLRESMERNAEAMRRLAKL